MVQYQRFVLDNGLRVIVCEDANTPMATVNVLYDVGSRDDNPNRTGFAHLFEHLMFEGSQNVPYFDREIYAAAGENNAFTANDMTNYYETLPAQNIETAFWLESDRMAGLAFSQKKLDIQKGVVCEEFKEVCLNQPYGDVWHTLRALCYKQHPYRWPVIGKELSHIENAELEDVKSFFFKHYRPDNAILTVAGGVSADKVVQLARKWFGDIPTGKRPPRQLPIEPPQKEYRFAEVTANVPNNAVYMAFRTCKRLDPQYYVIDLLSDLLSSGSSSRLYQQLVKKQQLFSSIHAYQTGDMDEGTFYIFGQLSKNVAPKTAENAILKEVQKLVDESIGKRELQRMLNKIETSNQFSEVSSSNKAFYLAYYELLGDVEGINTEMGKYRNITPAQIREVATSIFRTENLSTVHYLAEN